ncbi:MAG: transglutaminase-like domain-containing protein [Muribaculaceae bacterium]|nr:transglutaminase-like domain-containing protein [Muribaculaceae bacterium]
MRDFRLICFMIFVAFLTAAASDNVSIREKNVTYELKAEKGRLSSVKKIEETHYVAERADELIMVAEFYDDRLTIDKASAPGAKPIYRSWESTDLFFTGSRICAMAVSLKKGKPVKVCFEQTYTAPEQFTDIILAPDAPITGKATYTVIVPSQLAESIILTPRNLPQGVDLSCTTGKSGDKTYSITLSDQPKFEPEPLCGSATACAPRIEISGYFKDTEDLYRYLKGHVADDEPSSTVAALSRQLCEGMDTDMERIDTVAAWVRNNIRYVGIEHGVYAFRPEKADVVLEKRFADCKGSANLIRAMLQAVGIDCRLVWIGSRFDTTGSWSENPSLSAGNHMIAAAMLPDTTIFIDGTIKMAPAGLIPSAIAGQPCMIDGGDTPLLGTVPEQAPDVNKIILNGELEIDRNCLNGIYEATYTGQERLNLENIISSRSAYARTGVLERLMAFNRKGVKTGAVNLKSPALNAPATSVTFEESDPSGIRVLSSGKIYVLPRPFRAAEFTRINSEHRHSPIETGRKKTFETKLSINIPEGYVIDSLPEKNIIKSAWFEGFVEYLPLPDGHSVVCEAVLRSTRDHGEPDEANSWNEAIKEIEKISNTPITIKPL